MTWMDSAACAGQPPSVFFDPDQEQVARLICSTCVVSDNCLAAAINAGEWEGVRAGMNGRDRYEWAKANGIPRHGTISGYTNDRCRCDRCREVAADYARQSRARRAEAAA